MKKSNPFIVAGKIPDEFFCDRREESARLVRDVTNGNNLVLISQRRMGKTGLIQHCYDMPEIKDHYETFYIDILQTSSLKEFTYIFGKEIFKRLASRSERRLKNFMAMLRSIAGSFGFDPFSGTPTFNLQLGDIAHPEVTLDEIFRYLNESEIPTIIAIDEFQQISAYKEKNVEAMLRSHIQKLPNSNFIFAGSERHLLKQMFVESARPFFNSASFLELHPIELPDYAEFATLMFELNGRRVSRKAIDAVYTAFEGNTFYLQKTFNAAYSKTESDMECGVDTAKEAVMEMLASFDTLYREVLSGVGEAQKQLLIAIAGEKEATGITSSGFIRKHALASASSVQNAAKKLTAISLITRNSSGYKIQDPLLRLWLLQTYTSSDVM